MKTKQLYRVTFPNGFILARYGEEQYLSFVDETSVDRLEHWEFTFTEQEIKDFDESYWSFAVEVSEC